MIQVEDFTGMAGEVEAAAGLQEGLSRLMAEREALRRDFDVKAAAIEEALEGEFASVSGQMVLEDLARRLTEIEYQISALLSRILNMLMEAK